MLIRKPHVAGSFYPSDSSELFQFCQDHIHPSQPVLRAKAIILPHAGYIYSGATACRVLSRVEIPERNLLIGPNHRALGSDFAVFPRGSWETPMGISPIDEDLAASLLEASHDIHDDRGAHEFEHSLEVLLPLLQYKNKSLKFTPLLVGTLDMEWAAQVADSAGEILASKSYRPLVVVSSDMSHYESDEAVRAKDRYAIDAILNLDERSLVRAVRRYQISMCGIAPVFMLLSMKKHLGLNKAALVDYSTSGDATGERERVVGYAGFIFE